MSELKTQASSVEDKMSIPERNLEILLQRMVILASDIRDGKLPYIKRIELSETRTQSPLSDLFRFVMDEFLKLSPEHSLRAKYSIKEVDSAIKAVSQYERSYSLIDPEYFFETHAA